MQLASSSEAQACPHWLLRALPALFICIELGLILLTVHLFEIEKNHHFFPLLALGVCGFFIHTLLTPRLRPGFFALLSMGASMLFLGWADGALILGLGGLIIMLASLPIPFPYRVALVAIAGLGLASLRAEYERPFWAIFGAMFMFRILIYLHDTRRSRDRISPFHTLSYFFQLPNLCFTLYPVVDFKTYRASYRENNLAPVYQTGISWIVRGLVHLLVYRAIRYFLLPTPRQLTDLPQVTLFLATNYALYLRVSGIFHIIAGMLHLFGYELPRTHQNYFLASSFTDIWRRINVYWKDFMAKMFFFPTLFACRRFGERAGFVAATLCVFVATWLLHAYQVFWLLGTLPISWMEGALWLAAGVLVALNMQLELSRSDRPSLTNQAPTFVGALSRSSRTVGMFLLVSVFWAFWNSPNIVREIPARCSPSLKGAALLAGVLVLAVAGGVVVQLVREYLCQLRLLPVRYTLIGSNIGMTALLLALVLVATVPGTGIFGSSAATSIASLRIESATPAEAAQAVQGYYEELTASHVEPGSWLALMEGRPLAKRYNFYTAMTRASDPWLERELIPGWSGELEDTGCKITINRLGMRDRQDLAQAKRPNTCRLAMVGSSVVMGYGVGDSETFPYLLDNQLNSGRPPDSPRIEVLNFGTGNSQVIHRHVLIDRKVFAFSPDALYYFAHQDEFQSAYKHLARLAINGTPLPYPCLHEAVQSAGIKVGTNREEAQLKLEPYAAEIVKCVYRDLVNECRKRGIQAVWIYLPIPAATGPPVGAAPFVEAATEAGFTVVNLSDWSKGSAPADVKLSASDEHPNALGQSLIAQRLFDLFRSRPDLLPRCVRGLQQQVQ
jgi:hypothetical protein